MNAGIIGIGTYVPETIIDNHYFENYLETTDEWIVSRTGIKERRFADQGMDVSDMAYYAALQAIEDAAIKLEDIDLILVATSTGDHHFPSVACQLQHRLKLSKVPAMDQLAACTGFIYSLITAQQFILSGNYRNILVVGADKLSKITNMEDRNTAVLFGDGAGAVIVSQVSDNYGIQAYNWGSDGSGAFHLYDDKESGYLKMNGREVFKFAVRILEEQSQLVMDKAGLHAQDIDMLIPHQANTRIIESARERLGLSASQVSTTLDKYGNTSAASIPLSIAYECQNGKIKNGDQLILTGFGGGLTFGAIALIWGQEEKR
ncbi:ketoacyl-ACP synthase III [Macrococcus caseolyticus]|uniref:beta-ketoacyl-ACP synthase III n=1 Tax=Macrococcoides caseolyticum TaxID=69966 RepID=UPI002DBDA036|nr:beta-ketoacyl-ACP synthase III [Macrococcus caseolyticus]MEB8170569.1 ketoacyl-ACP synthase III [Macrococcus caseolyticus]